MDIQDITGRVLSGGEISKEEALQLVRFVEDSARNREALYESSHRITHGRSCKKFDTCAIISVKGGKCSEDCKWCAQSAHYNTGTAAHGLPPEEEFLEKARCNEKQGVGRFSCVSSGRKLLNEELNRLLAVIRRMKKETSIGLCASLGLLDYEELTALREAGVTRYHCNLETGASFFESMCTTHTQQDKINTLKAARKAGLDICSGGIFNVGENMEHRVELAFTLRELGVKTIPLNILHPIAGTPLEGRPPMADDELLTTVALFRFINPDAYLRFAGGRLSLSEEVTDKALYIGVNASITGDMLTIKGIPFEKDKKRIERAGYTNFR